MRETLEKVKQLIRETGMLRNCTHVVAGVSGGADSVFLFYALRQLESEYGFRLHIVHVNHEIRGAEADEDEQFVRDLCGKYGVPLAVRRRNIPELARQQGMTLEEAGRYARYEIFHEEARKLDGDVRIALAHHQNDVAETLLFQMARGCSLDGMASIRPVRDNVIRPLLAVTKEEILAYLTERSIPWREDSTNADNDAVRNRLRHDVIPYLIREINAGTVSHFAAEAADCAEAADFIREEAARRAGRYVSCGSAENCDYVISDGIQEEPDILRREIIRQTLARLTGSLKDISRVHIVGVDGLFRHSAGAELDLPYGLVAERDRTGVHLRRRERGNEYVPCSGEGTQKRVAPLLPETAETFGGYAFSAELISREDGAIPEKRYTKWFDYDTINTFSMTIRYREPGDFLTVNAEGGRKKLSDYFTDEKVPVQLRDRIPVLASGKEIIWIVGMRIGYRFRVSPETKRVLSVTAVQRPEQEDPD